MFHALKILNKIFYLEPLIEYSYVNLIAYEVIINYWENFLDKLQKDKKTFFLKYTSLPELRE